MIYYNDTVAERLRRWTANPFPSGIASSNLVGIVFFGDVDQLVDRSLCMRDAGGSKPPISKKNEKKYEEVDSPGRLDFVRASQ